MRPLYQIADQINNEWKKVWFGAVPYLQALQRLSHVEQNYGADSADSIVRYFLANANTFRGGNAPKLKAELKQHVGIKLSKKEKELLS